MKRTESLPLIGLLGEGILPAEELKFTAPVLNKSSLVQAGKLEGKRIVALFIASRVEIPAFCATRWATECTVMSATATAIVLRGERRVRIRSTSGTAERCLAVVETSKSGPVAPHATAAVAAAHAVFAALDAGAVPDNQDWAEHLGPALASVQRALSHSDQIRSSQGVPQHEALDALAKSLASRASAHTAVCTLEQMIRQLSENPEPSLALKHQLWTACVEIQKRLDVYDPSVGDDASDLVRLQRRIDQAGLPRYVSDVAKRELRLLRGMKTDHHDYSGYVRHLDWLARLPWHADAPPALDLAAVESALDRQHAGLEKAKRRVLEYLAVRSLGGSRASMVLCLAGPPGVGKTSIARAMATALRRTFVSVPLGGVHDECEIRGHRMSFLAAAPGRIISGIDRAGSRTGVVLLDEIDKMGTDTARSPYAALLEILDPEQNARFQDNYLDVPFDLSNVLFIATANEVDHVHATLRDRLEIVELEGYTVREKELIAREHLLGRLREESGLPAPLTIESEALRLVIEGHTREAGVRQLQRTLGAIHRARAVNIVKHGSSAPTGPIDLPEVARALGAPRHSVTSAATKLPPGVATGLSVSVDGGALLFIEIGITPGGHGELELTGRLGKVMRESAKTALAHVRLNLAAYGIARERLFECDFHVHVPEGATPKDGPSAGLALVTAIASAARGVALRGDLALTGEITLTGRVLPVGAIRAKVLAAERAGIRSVIVPEGNRADAPEGLALEVKFVSEVSEALRTVLADGATG